MTDETAQQKIERLETEVKNLRLGMGALIVCLVRVGVEGRFPFSDDSQVLGLPIAMGRAGIPPAAAKILRRYSTEAVVAEQDALVEAADPSEEHAKIIQAAFEQPQEIFDITCPVLGTRVTRHPRTGDSIRVRDANGRWYSIADSARSLLREPLNAAAKEHVRAWLHREWRSGTECPLICSAQVQEAIESGFNA